jgi:hypothetical protein
MLGPKWRSPTLWSGGTTRASPSLKSRTLSSITTGRRTPRTWRACQRRRRRGRGRLTGVARCFTDARAAAARSTVGLAQWTRSRRLCPSGRGACGIAQRNGEAQAADGRDSPFAPIGCSLKRFAGADAGRTRSPGAGPRAPARFDGARRPTAAAGVAGVAASSATLWVSAPPAAFGRARKCVASVRPPGRALCARPSPALA